MHYWIPFIGLGILVLALVIAVLLKRKPKLPSIDEDWEIINQGVWTDCPTPKKK